ncbi:MAG: 2-phospho-L-lactate transferase [Candidatus Methanofastidiosa archaeon]|nr:2-phospho-L-lactate transferase [Candidatus Methanofastidiosa archaeon]
MITVLSGGTGTPKLLMGMQRVKGKSEISIIANTGEDLEQSGVFMSPDVDSVVYALAGIIDKEKWYGIGGDSFKTYEALLRLGHRELLRMGDMDRATKILRTIMLRSGSTLSEATEAICQSLGVNEPVFPMTDDRVTTTLLTEQGPMAFHDYWVRDRAEHVVGDVIYKGSESASIPKRAADVLARSDAVVIGPSNPITSIMPILSIREIRKACKEKRVIAVSPIIARSAFSGPAGKLMRDMGYEVSPAGVADAYQGLLDAMVIDRSDAGFEKGLREKGIDVVMANITMENLNKSKALGKDIFEYLVIQ